MDKMTLLVSPNEVAHNTQHWYDLAIFLSRHLHIQLSLETAIDMQDFRIRLAKADIAYVPPQDAATQTFGRNFKPLCKIQDCYEELAVISNQEVPVSGLQGLQGSVIGGVAGTFPNRLGMTLLRNKGITPTSIANKESWPDLLSSLVKNEIHYAFISKNYLRHTRQSERCGVQMIANTNLRKAFPQLMLNPLHLRFYNEIRDTLLAMHLDEAGRDILEKHKTRIWTEVDPFELNTMTTMLKPGRQASHH